MLNKELLMASGAKELWTIRCKFTGKSHINLILQDSNGQTLWNGHPSTDIVTVRVPPKSILQLSGVVGMTTKADGCRVKVTRNILYITLFQSEAYLEMLFLG